MDVSPTKNTPPTLQELEEISYQNIVITPSQNVSPPTLIPQPPSSNTYLYIFCTIGVLTVFMLFGTLFIKSPSPKKIAVSQNSSMTPTSPTAIPLISTAYANPFDETSSYENPFSEESSYENPFEDIQ